MSVLTTSLSAQDIRPAVLTAVGSIDDPEYPGVSIADLGLVEHVEVTSAGAVCVQLIPTFSGCPALAMIAADVEAAVRAVAGVSTVTTEWLLTPVWTTDRITPVGRAALADRFTVSVQIGRATPSCPRCGAAVAEQSMFGPSRCRSVSRCTACAETVEVMRS